MSQTNLVAIDELKAKVSTFLGPLQGLEVRDRAGNAAAAGSLVTVKSFQNEIESLRKAAVAPLNEQVKQINNYARSVLEPLIAAEANIKNHMNRFAGQEKDRIAKEKQEAEATARAEREKRDAEERIAARARHDAEEEERARLHKEAEENRKAEAAKRSDEMKAFGVAEDAKAEQARRNEIAEKSKADRERIDRELDEKRMADKARQDRERAEAESAAALKQKALDGERLKNTRQVWKFEVIDKAALPDAYWKVDEVALGTAVRTGAREIPGVKIWSEDIIVAGR